MIISIVHMPKELFLNIFFPKKCILCNVYGSHLCASCAKDIEPVITSLCPLCGKISQNGKICSECRKSSGFVLKGIISAAVYSDGPMKEVIHHLKYSGLTDLSEVVGEIIVQKLSSIEMIRNAVIVPVPLNKKRQAERGFNQSELIARYVAKSIGISGANALGRTRDTTPQAELKRANRLTNLSNCFQIADREFVAGKLVLLLDDVATTGTTLNECAKVLIASGAKEVWGVVAAHG